MLFNRFIVLNSNNLVLNIGVKFVLNLNKELNCNFNIVFNKDGKKFSLRNEIDLFFLYINSIFKHGYVLPCLIDYNKLIVSKNGMNYIFSYFVSKKLYKFTLSFETICELKEKELAIKNYTTLWHLDSIRDVVVYLLHTYREKIFKLQNITFITDDIYEKDIIYEIILNSSDYKNLLKLNLNGLF